MNVFWRGTRALAGSSLLALMAACGGGGGGGGDGGNGGNGGNGGGGSPGGNGSGGYVLFTGDNSVGSIAAFKSLDPSQGQPMVAHDTQSADGIRSIVYDTPGAHVVMKGEGGISLVYDAGHDDLYVLHIGVYPSPTQLTIDVFAHASTMADDDAIAQADQPVPARTILVSGFVAGLSGNLQLDTTRDELWIGGYSGQEGDTLGRIVVLAHASTLNGLVTPTRDISGLPNFDTFAHDRVHDTLYLAGGGGVTHGVYMFAQASTLAANAPVTRTIDVGAYAGTSSDRIAVDEQRDILYVPDPFNGLQIVRNASTASVASATVPLPDPGNVATVDSAHDRLYLETVACSYVFDNASTLTSTSVVQRPAVVGAGAIWSFAF